MIVSRITNFLKLLIVLFTFSLSSLYRFCFVLAELWLMKFSQCSSARPRAVLLCQHQRTMNHYCPSKLPLCFCYHPTRHRLSLEHWCRINWSCLWDCPVVEPRHQYCSRWWGLSTGSNRGTSPILWANSINSVLFMLLSIVTLFEIQLNTSK